MKRDRVRALLAELAAGRVTVAEALHQLDDAPIDEIGFASVDNHRALRQGFPEVVFAQGKTEDQVVGICDRLARGGDGFLVTRASAEVQTAVVAVWPTAVANAIARTVLLKGESVHVGKVALITAGTSDIPVAEEAAVTLEALGLEHVVRLTDVGVAGIHRLLSQRDKLQGIDAAIVVAGMDGALPSVVGGIVRCPVIAVPTSVGYGAAFEGLAPLLTMLNSCAAGVTVCNIDNGFGAAMAVGRILFSRDDR